MTFATFAMNATDKTGAFEWQAGYRFEFYCELCKTPWQPGYQVDDVQNASDWARVAAISTDSVWTMVAANSMLAAAASGAAERRQQAFQTALWRCQQHFRECPSCLSIVCPNCVVPSGICRWCHDHGRTPPAPGQQPQPLYRVNPVAGHPPCRRCQAPYMGTRFCGNCGLEYGLP